MLKKILLALLLVLVVLQFFRIDKTNPAVNPKSDFLLINQANPAITEKIKAACYDCHSHETSYPWYTNVAPLSFWIRGHIKGGRLNLNFTTWSRYTPEDQAHHIKESIDEIKARHMPLKSYTWAHPDAQLSETDITDLVRWFEQL